jgi:hypothetical protein
MLVAVLLKSASHCLILLPNLLLQAHQRKVLHQRGADLQ